jgi:DNA-directed RNA polymerase specialized sigma24 family protein
VEALFRRYQRPLFHTALRVLGNVEDAEDALSASERFADSGPNPEQVSVSTELSEMISENLDELSPLLRTAFVLREVQSYSTGEAAKKLRSDREHFEGASLARTPPAQRLGQRLRRIK